MLIFFHIQFSFLNLHFNKTATLMRRPIVHSLPLQLVFLLILISIQFSFLNLLFSLTRCLNEEVNCTEPSPLVCVPCPFSFLFLNFLKQNEEQHSRHVCCQQKEKNQGQNGENARKNQLQQGI